MSTEKETLPQKEVKNIELKTILGWIIGPLTVLGGVVMLPITFVGSVIYILTGLYIIPPLSEMFARKTGVRLGFWAKVLVILGLWTLATLIRF